MSRPARTRAGGLALAAAALAGCAALTAPPPRPALPVGGGAQASAAVGSAALAWAEPGLPAEGPIELEHVLVSIDRSFPALLASLEGIARAEGELLASQGAFDAWLRAAAQWNATGFYENHSADAWVEQPTPLWGATFLGGYRLGTGDFDPTYDGKRVTNHGGELRAGVRVPLLRGGPIDAARAGIAQAGLDVDLAELELLARRLEVQRAGALAYWTWVAAARRLAVAERLLENARARMEGVARRAAQGDLPAIEAVDNRRLVVERQGGVVSARRAFERARLALALFVRDAQGAPVLLDAARSPALFPEHAEPHPEHADRDVTAALERRPEPRRLRAQRERAEVDLELARNALLPTLDVRVLASQDLDRRDPSRTKGEFELEAGLVFGLPVQQRAARGKAAAAQAAVARLEAEERLVRDRVALEVQDAHSALVAAWERVAQAREARALAQQVEDAERRAFELGQSTILLVNLREQATADAAAKVIEALADLFRADADLRAATGRLDLP